MRKTTGDSDSTELTEVLPDEALGFAAGGSLEKRSWEYEALMRTKENLLCSLE
jgi:hypothetical protein